MKLVTFTKDGETSIGVYHDGKIIDLHTSFVQKLIASDERRAQEIANTYIPRNMVGFLEGGKKSFEYGEEAIQFAIQTGDPLLIFDRNDVRLEAPIQRPQKMICVGQNYREHILEMGRELPEYPVLFAKFPNAIIGPEDNIPFHPISEQLDYEAEFAFVIGKRAKNVSEEDALDYVAGYTIGNDVTYRDIQRRTLQWLQGKSVDGSAPLGPWLVTSDEIADPSGLDISLSVNGELRQKSNTENLVFTIPKLVAFISKLMTLEPGDIIMTGTPAGVGFAMEPQGFLKDGDVVRIEIENIGVLENKVEKV
ncbi:MAG TPA: fumarylacetoacetate hydrolase family protein [Cerasibacillus sp.]|uniref:fumarylacetoacetate hydrolase family protein n=1 Tax=Cerasibacillus sp. TaxID=2498711 RepID=UPI002F3F44D5